LESSKTVNDDILTVEGDMLRMWEICDHEGTDHVFTIEEMVRSRQLGGGGRQAYTVTEYKSSIMPKLKKLNFIKMLSDNAFRLSAIGRIHCRKLRAHQLI
jgi:hypothetical protein